MKSNARVVFTLLALAVAGLLAFWVRSGPKDPVAVLRVVDAAGRPIAGAVIQPDGLRSKAGPYQSGHYGWNTGPRSMPNARVSTDPDGFARVGYPKYVFERIETGEISFSVAHPDFVPDRPFRVVNTVPPRGAPWAEWAVYAKDRLLQRRLLARTEPVVLQRGAVLKLSVRAGAAANPSEPLFAQASGVWDAVTNFWVHPFAGVVETGQLGAGNPAVRAVQFAPDGVAWFSDVRSLVSVAGETNEIAVDLHRGLRVRGQLADAVPRPVRNGRVIAHVWPPGLKPETFPPQWHAWSAVAEDGTFDLRYLPPGDLEIVALCQGYVSTNGPGQFPGLRYPQKHRLVDADLDLVLAMEPTARLEVRVLDDHGQPLPGASVATSPNVRYGEWSATILAGDCYNSAEVLVGKPLGLGENWFRSVADFRGQSDASGWAVVPNLPVEVSRFYVEHSNFALPALGTPGGAKDRESKITLTPGQTSRITVQLELRGRSPIAHY